MKKLCIIPARGGSKRLPGKNIRKLDNKPLIFHTIDATLGLFDKVIINSQKVKKKNLQRALLIKHQKVGGMKWPKM